MKKHAVSSLKRRWSGIIKSPNGVCSLVEHKPSMCVSDAGLSGFSSIVSERTAFNPGTTNRVRVFLSFISLFCINLLVSIAFIFYFRCLV